MAMRPCHTMVPSRNSSSGRDEDLPTFSILDLKLPLLLCLAYTKLQEWYKMHIMLRRVLECFPCKNSRGLPSFKRDKDAERWVRLIIFQGVACSFLGVSTGVEFFPRAKGCFVLAQRAQPKNRTASRGV